MPTLHLDDIADRAINSLNQLQKGAWIDAMAAYQDVPLARVAHTMGKETSGK